MPPNQFRDGECRAGTGSLIVRACAAVVLAVCLVSGLATGTRDAAAAVFKVQNKDPLEYGSAAGDADLTGTVVVSPAGAKTVTGGASDFGGVQPPSKFQIKTDTDGEPYSCTLPSSIQVTSGANNMTVDTFTTSHPLVGSMDPGSTTLEMFIGATVHLAAGQAAGNYSGSFTFDCDGISDVANVTITIAAPISLSNTASLNFGDIGPTGAGGTVTVTPAGVRTSVNVDLFGGIPSAAGFTTTGETGQVYAITLPSIATLTSGGNTMTLDTFTDDGGVSPTLVGGSDTFNVGGTLNVAASTNDGAYSGSFSVTVNYN